MSVQEVLGDKTLDMTMRICAKIHAGTKREAVAKLSYGSGSTQADVLEYPAGGEALVVQNGHQSVNGPNQARNEST